MEIFLAVVLLLVGFLFIIKGGDWFVDSASWVARIAGIPQIIVGATIVSIGTTLPELITSLTAAVKSVVDSGAATDMAEIAVGNSVGSMLCNTGLILALVLLIKPPKAGGRDFATKGITVLIVTVLFSVFALTNSKIELWEGIVLLVMFVIFMSMNIFDAVKDNKLTGDSLKKIEQKAEAMKENKTKMILKFIAGAAGIAAGAYMLVESAQKLGLAMGIPRQILAVTVVAIGTSLPELVTSFSSLKKGTSDIGLGNILGAHVINSTLILGMISVVTGKGMAVDAITRNVAVWVVLGIMSVLVIPTIFMKKTTRWQGAVLLSGYLGFMIYNIVYVAQSLN